MLICHNNYNFSLTYQKIFTFLAPLNILGLVVVRLVFLLAFAFLSFSLCVFLYVVRLPALIPLAFRLLSVALVQLAVLILLGFLCHFGFVVRLRVLQFVR